MINEDKWIKKEECSFPSTNILSAGRAGFEPAVEVFPRQPLSRRPQSTTLAPPLCRVILCPNFQAYTTSRQQFQIYLLKAEGEGFEPPVGVNPQLFSRQPP